MSNFPSNAAIRKALLPFGFDASAEMCEKIRVYGALLLKWNQKMNLTSIKDPVEILTRHFGESLFALPQISSGATSLLDIGSGAGFPGLVLKMARPDMQVTLLEPVLKKVAFLKEAARGLGVEVNVSSGRAGESNAETALNCITSRAVRLDPSLLDWIHGSLRPKGLFIAWLGNAEAVSLVQDPSFTWNTRPLPKSLDNYLVVGRKG